LDSITLSEALGNDYVVISVPSATACLTALRDPKNEHYNVVRNFDGKIYLGMDQDKAGDDCANAFLKELRGKNISRLTWDRNLAKDIGELYSLYKDRFQEQFQKLCKEAEQVPLLWRKAPSFADLQEMKFEYVVDGFLPAGEITILTGDFGSYKSYLSYFIADAVSGGTEFANHRCQKHPVLILDRENSAASVSLRRNLVGNLKNRKDVRLLGTFTDPKAPELNDPQLLKVCRDTKPVIIIDSLTDFHPGKKENDADDMTAVFAEIRNLITAGAKAVLVLHHVPKSGKGNGGSYRGSTAIVAAGANAIVAERVERTVTLTTFKSRDGENTKIRLSMFISKDKASYEVISSGPEPEMALNDRILGHIFKNESCSTEDVRIAVKARKESVVASLKELEAEGKICRSEKSKGRWVITGRHRESFQQLDKVGSGFLQTPDRPEIAVPLLTAGRSEKKENSLASTA